MSENKKEESFIGKIIGTIPILGLLFYIGLIGYMFITSLFTVGLFNALGMAFVGLIPIFVFIFFVFWISD